MFWKIKKVLNWQTIVVLSRAIPVDQGLSRLTELESRGNIFLSTELPPGNPED